MAFRKNYGIKRIVFFTQMKINLYGFRHQVGKKSLESIRNQLLKTEVLLAR